MSAGILCTRCGERFWSGDAFDAHVNNCTRTAEFREPRFRERHGREVAEGELRFGESTFDELDGVQVSLDTQVEVVDRALRTGRIRSVAWEPEEQPSVWRRIWNRIHGK